jgi:hypothetical protein
MPKEHMTKVMDLYKRLPEHEQINYRLYEKITHDISNDGFTNGEIVSTLKTIVIMLCEECVANSEKMDYERIQEANV